MSIVAARGLRKVYPDLTAVDGVSLDIDEGEIFGLLGPNGSGKTTTINMLTGLSRPTAGEIAIAGIDAVRNTKKAQELMGIVSDESNLYDEMDGFQNLCFCASLYGMGKKDRERRALDLLDRFGLSGLEGRPFSAYSKGMKRKLTIAAGIINRPKVLFLDEPTTGIDIESTRDIRNMISDLREDGTAILLTTHYIEEAERLCDRISLIVKGRIVSTGSVEELSEDPEGGRHSVLFRIGTAIDPWRDDLRRVFPESEIRVTGEDAFALESESRIPINPVVRFWEERGIPVFEARERRHTLEDAFVRITGIEADKMRREKEGRGR